jgi:hypothetical protein
MDDMTWRQFELYCEDLMRSIFSDSEYRVSTQHNVTYSDGMNKRLDMHIAERRRGGRGFVIDFKHFKTASLNKNKYYVITL